MVRVKLLTHDEIVLFKFFIRLRTNNHDQSSYAADYTN